MSELRTALNALIAHAIGEGASLEEALAELHIQRVKLEALYAYELARRVHARNQKLAEEAPA